MSEGFEQVLNRWKQAFGEYEQLQMQAESAVVRWEWAKGERHSLLPFHFNRFPGRGRALTGPPTSPGYYVHYGFDTQNRVRLERLYGYLDIEGRERLASHIAHGVDTKDTITQTYYAYHNTVTDIIEFSVPPRIPLKVDQVFYENGRVVRHASFKLNGYTPLYSEKGGNPDGLYKWLGYNGRFKTLEQYVYEGERLTAIVSSQETPGVPPSSFTEQFSYDDRGVLMRIERFWEGGSKQVVYQKREKGETFRSIRAAGTEKLVQAIIARVRAASIRDQVYCIELSYQAVSHYFPPLIVPGLESDRAKLLNSGDPDARYRIFAPVLQNRERFLEIHDPVILAICDRLEQEIQAGQKWTVGTDILRHVAAALTRYDWTGILEITPDFVVFAIDHEMEGDQLGNVLSASASKELIKTWKQKGWL